MPRSRQAVIRAKLAQNRPARVNPQGVGWKNPPGGPAMGVGQGRPARPSNGRGGRPGGQGPNNAGMAPHGASQAPNAMPWDSVATTGVAIGQRNYANETAGIGANEEFTRRNIGLGQGYENNPYSEASLLQRQREIGNRGTLNAAGNQLYSGSTINRLGGVERGYQQGRYGLEQRLAAKEAQWMQERQRAETRQEEAAQAAQEGAIERAQKEAPEPAPVNEGGRRKNKRRKRR